MMNEHRQSKEQQVKGFCYAALFHAAFLSSFFLYNFAATHFVGGLSAWIIKGTYSILFLLSVIAFYFRPDIFLLSPSIRIKILTRCDTRLPLSASIFYITKFLVWFLVLVLPVPFFIFSELIPNFVRVYLMFAYLFFLVFNNGFLFTGYQKYLNLKYENKWGILSVY